MSRRILISVDPYEARAALMEGDRLINVEIEGTSAVKRKGNIYRGRVTSVQASLGAAFVDYGAQKDGFLPLEDVSPKSLVRFSGHSNGRSPLRVGDPVLVQVTKEEFGRKGATLTTYVSLPGRFVVLMPFSERTGVSRKLPSEERARLRRLASRLRVPEGFGFIVRTVGEEEDLEDLQADLDSLVQEWREIEKTFHERRTVGEIHAEISLTRRFVRDYLTSEVTEVWVEDEASYRDLAEYLRAHMPDRLGILKRYEGNVPLFLQYGVESQIDALLQNRVPLPSGGSIVIAQTEALVAIDVNSGRTRQTDLEGTALKTNLEAAREIARQLILRDLGGIVVVDFIDMESEAHRRAVEQELRSCLRADKARLTFTPIQEFGLLILTRQRLRQSMDSGITLPCPTCQGTGRVRSPSLQAMAALRRIRERLATSSGNIAYVEVTVPLEVAHFLANRKREALLALERKFDVLIDVFGDPASRPDALRLSALPDVPASRRAIHGAEDEEPEISTDPEDPVPVPVAAPRGEGGRSPEPPRQRSFLKGLLTRVLGLDEASDTPTIPRLRPAEVPRDPSVSVQSPPPPEASAKTSQPPSFDVPDPSPAPSPPLSADPGSPPNEKPKRRRRRRRRRSGTESRPEATATAGSALEASGEGTIPTSAPVPTTSVPSPDSTTDVAPEPDPESRVDRPEGSSPGETPRKRRRRRRRRTSTVEEASEGTGGPPGTPPESRAAPVADSDRQGEGTEHLLSDPPPQEPVKPSGRRRRKPRAVTPPVPEEFSTRPLEE